MKSNIDRNEFVWTPSGTDVTERWREVLADLLGDDVGPPGFVREIQ